MLRVYHKKFKKGEPRIEIIKKLLEHICENFEPNFKDPKYAEESAKREGYKTNLEYWFNFYCNICPKGSLDETNNLNVCLSMYGWIIQNVLLAMAGSSSKEYKTFKYDSIVKEKYISYAVYLE